MATDIFNKIAALGEAEAEKTMLEVEVLAHIIADKMEHLHGLPYRIQINHELAFIVVTPR
ncbi:hypothetical protein EN814_16300 [Mesorhizobium sp. M2D.F.Ca.ET.171.01.1.1]|uniref:hypothetical protein n=1 Tax=unclassified Mesorhizobium TaxID=325217 RepID=UPI001092936C|nr:MULTISPECIES: hypothetical protein [unclassified Mesorhizobium]TGS95263.1 hypothetical protein EN821_16315 [Mesorhizobium sp. M2D.F.Ca.ET.178.01.1.1]TGT10802.1 hypothetical protein EN814_16300 [Mesorhizobium sp. M2D.F.Ca.ET.171.01.1.1]